MKRTAIVVEDQDIVREGLCSLLSIHSEYEVVAQAADGVEAIHMVELHEPDIVLMDLSLPRLDGTHAIKDIKRRFPKIKILALTAYKKEGHIRGALSAGADGYALKNLSADDLVEAMDVVLAGHRYVSPAIPESLVENAEANGGASVIDNLSEREVQVLRLVVEGKGNKGTADELCISVKTVEKHKANLVRKLGLESATDILTFAHEYGLFN